VPTRSFSTFAYEVFCHGSRPDRSAFLVRAYLLQTHEMLFDAPWHGFRVLGGIPECGIYDNMKTAVDRIGRGKEPLLGNGGAHQWRAFCRIAIRFQTVTGSDSAKTG
jgi:hypothetical protein